jgi:hypothetical protein
MRKFRNILIILSAALLVVHLVQIALNDWIWKENRGSYFGIIAAVSIIISMVLSNRHDRRQGG